MHSPLGRLTAIAAVTVGLTVPLGLVAVPTATAAALPAPQAGAEVFTRPADGSYDVVGGGFGHGIGMSQFGAQGAATKGLGYARILAFYYPGTSLVTQTLSAITVGITGDNDGVVRVGARPGLAVTIGGVKSTLPSAPTQWRVRATGTTAATCQVESYDGSAWASYRAGNTPCPVTFSGTEGTVDLYLPSGERRVYRGTITAHHRGTTSLATLNRTSMQDYLRGVVPSEMPASWAAEALKSQAVAARTYAARGSNSTSYYDTCDTTSCQVYKGSGKRNADGTVTSYEYPSTNDAIDATLGKVLQFRFTDGVTRLATTMYSSSNGGQTAPGSSTHPYLKAQPDPYDAVSLNSRHAWEASLPLASLESRFGIYRVERLQVLGRDGYGEWGGRVLKVRVEGFTSTGTYASVDTTGNGIVGARSWPTYSGGLSSNYFTILRPSATTTVSRIAGSDRYGTAAAASRAYPVGVSVVYVASGLDFPDALTGAARAAYNSAPLLLTRPDRIPTATRDAMTGLRPGRVVVLGSTGAISDALAQELRSMTTTGDLQRVGGADRYATAAALAMYYPYAGKVAYIATGADYPDAVAGAALAGKDRAPVLLTTSTSLPSVTADALARLAPQRIVILGGTAAVSSSVASSLVRYATSGTVTRLGGSDRYATAAAIGAQFPSAQSAYVASGEDFPDALAASALAGSKAAPVLLTKASTLPTVTRQQLVRLDPAAVYLMGGSAVTSDALITAIRSALD